MIGRRSVLALVFTGLISALCLTNNAKAQFSVTGYYQDPNVANQYDIVGADLSEVTKMTISPYAPQGDVNTNVQFNVVSDQELTFTLAGTLSNDVDLTFSDPDYSLVGVTLIQTSGRNYIPLNVVADGQTLQGGGGSSRVLVEAGGSYGNGGGGGNVEFIENGGTFTGNSGGGGNTTYFEPYAYGSSATGGGGSNKYIEVNSIVQLSAINPSTILTGSNASTDPVALSSGTTTLSSPGSTGSGLLSLSTTGTSFIDYIGGTGKLSAAEIEVAQGGQAVIRNVGYGVLTLPEVYENAGVLVLSDGKFIVQGISGGEGSDPIIENATAGYTTTTTYSGPTTIEHGGALLTGIDGALPTGTLTDLTLGAVDDGGAGETNVLDLLGTSQSVDSLVATGPDKNVVMSSDGYANGSGAYGAGPVTGTGASSKTGTLTVNTTNYAGGVDTFSGSLGGSGSATNFSLVKSGTGTLALTGTNTYIGGTTVQGGTLLANSSNSTGTGALVVSQGGVLGGTGTITPSSVTTGNAVTISGELNPSAGNNNVATSTLTFALNPNATMRFTSGATALFDLGKSGVSDQVIIRNGTLDLSDLTAGNFDFVGLVGANGFSDGGLYNLFVAQDGATIEGLSGDPTELVSLDGQEYAATFDISNNDDFQVSLTAAVPEPGTLNLVLLGLVSVGILKFRRSFLRGPR